MGAGVELLQGTTQDPHGGGGEGGENARVEWKRAKLPTCRDDAQPCGDFGNAVVVVVAVVVCSGGAGGGGSGRGRGCTGCRTG